MTIYVRTPEERAQAEEMVKAFEAWGTSLQEVLDATTDDDVLAMSEEEWAEFSAGLVRSGRLAARVAADLTEELRRRDELGIEVV